MPRPNFFAHLHPPKIPRRQARFRHTLAAGGLSIFLSLVLLLTGLLEMFYYIPTPESAAHSVQTITYLVPWGAFIRNLHYWAAQLLMLTTALHLLRVIFTAAYLPPRDFNYLLGLALLVPVALLNFTGYILRWDEGIRWALVTGTNLLKTIPLVGDWTYAIAVGGVDPGAATLIRFYTWHILGLTLPVMILTVWHIFRLRRDGGIASPIPRPRPNERISRDELLRREVLAMLLAAVVLTLMAAFLPAPIAPPMEPSPPPDANPQAPWFFLWVQQLLHYGNPFLMGIIIPLGVLAAFAAIPYIFPRPKPFQEGTWFPRSGRIPQIMTVIIVFVILFLTLKAQ